MKIVLDVDEYYPYITEVPKKSSLNQKEVEVEPELAKRMRRVMRQFTALQDDLRKLYGYDS